MRRCILSLATLAWAFAWVGQGQAGVIFFTNEAAFDAAAGSLSTQTFASANIAPIGISVFANPLNSATNNGVFAAGSILPSLTLQSSFSHAGQDPGAAAPRLFRNPQTT